MLEADRMARAVLPRASSDVSFSILTSVYSRTPAPYFELTARSLLEQRHADFEWIVLENGPVSDDVARVLDRIAADPRVRRFACAENVGIQGAMRQCLARAARGFVVPLDADDVLEPDALEVLAAAIDREQADFVFSDEDHLTGDRAHAPYLRPGFDPVLNLGIFVHLASVRVQPRAGARARRLLGRRGRVLPRLGHDRPFQRGRPADRACAARALPLAEPCRVAEQRTDAESRHPRLDARGGRARASRGAVLSRQRYEIAEYPIFRGAVEWWIRRRPIDDPSFGVVVLGADERSSADAAACDSLARRTERGRDARSEWRRSTTGGGSAKHFRATSSTWSFSGSRWRPDRRGLALGGDQVVRAAAGYGDRRRPPGR